MELRPRESVRALVVLVTDFPMEFAAESTALIVVLIADVKEFVAVEAGGSSMGGMEALAPLVRTVVPAIKI